MCQKSQLPRQQSKLLTFLIVLLGAILLLSGCGLYEGGLSGRENIITPSPCYSELSGEQEIAGN